MNEKNYLLKAWNTWFQVTKAQSKKSYSQILD